MSKPCPLCLVVTHGPDRLKDYLMACDRKDGRRLKRIIAPLLPEHVDANDMVHLILIDSAECEVHLDPLRCEVPFTACPGCGRYVCDQCANQNVIQERPTWQWPCTYFPLCKPCARRYLFAHPGSTRLRSGKVYLPYRKRGGMRLRSGTRYFPYDK